MSEKKITYTTWGFKNELQYKLYINLFEIKKTLLKKPTSFSLETLVSRCMKNISQGVISQEMSKSTLCNFAQRMNPLHVFDKTVCQSLQIIYFEEDEY